MAGDFRVAARIIREGGLAKGSYEKGSAHCSVGALVQAVSPGRDHYVGAVSQVNDHVELLADLLGTPPSEPCSCGHPDGAFSVVTANNDRPETTEEQVIGLFEQAAEKLEAAL
jgi:hypothetical protein